MLLILAGEVSTDVMAIAPFYEYQQTGIRHLVH